MCTLYLSNLWHFEWILETFSFFSGGKQQHKTMRLHSLTHHDLSNVISLIFYFVNNSFDTYEKTYNTHARNSSHKFSVILFLCCALSFIHFSLLSCAWLLIHFFPPFLLMFSFFAGCGSVSRSIWFLCHDYCYYFDFCLSLIALNEHGFLIIFSFWVELFIGSNQLVSETLKTIQKFFNNKCHWMVFKLHLYSIHK